MPGDDQQDQFRNLHAPQVSGGERFERNSNGGAREKRIVDHLMLAAIAGLCWIIWTMKETQNAQQVSIATMQTIIALHDKQMESIQRRFDSFEGRNFRGEILGDADGLPSK